jgi:Tol biopolymer transport system component
MSAKTLPSRRPAPEPRPPILVLGLGLAALVVCLAVVGWLVLHRSSNSAVLEGRIAWPKDGDLWVYDLATKQQTKVTNLPSGAAVTGATWSPDGQRMVFAQFWRRPNDRSSGADLMLANADGSDAHPFAERDAPNTVLEAPEWMPSGRVYYTIRRVTAQGRETQSIGRQLEGGQPETLMDNAYSPAVSPDESTLIYIRSTRTGQQMMKKSLGDAGDGCELVSDQVFQYLSLPRVSPDGKRIAFGGSGEPSMGTTGCGGDMRSHTAVAAAPTIDLAALFQPDVAYAHGLPADVYSMNVDGSDMNRIADIKDDDPTVAFSPDGSKIAIFGVAALFVDDAGGGPTSKLTGQGGYGGLDWTR